MLVFKEFSAKVRLSPRDVYADNFIFRLHYRLTFWFLLACCVLVSSKQFIKSHINCMVDGLRGQVDVINSFCFFSTTFTVNKYYEAQYMNLSSHPGVGHHTDKDEIVQHAYYQWVPFVFFIQAIMFVIPHKMWKTIEQERLQKIVEFVRSSRLVANKPIDIKGHKIDTEDKKESNAKWLHKTYLSLRRFSANRDWAVWLVTCELLNAVNLILQIWFLDMFLQGKFYELGWDWWHGEESALDRVFPKVTKCTFHKYGASGNIQNHDALCVMALNIINEKIYCIMWFWFVILLLLDFLGLGWRLLTIFGHYNRYFNKFVWGEISPGPAIPRKDLTIITNNLCFSDWLFLYYLGKNISSDMFRRLVAQLSNELQMERRGTKLIQTDTPEGENSESFC